MKKDGNSLRIEVEDGLPNSIFFNQKTTRRKPAFEEVLFRESDAGSSS